VVIGLAALRQTSPAITDAVVARARAARRALSRRRAPRPRPARRVRRRARRDRDRRARRERVPDLVRTGEAARRVLLPLLRAGVVPVVPGFIGAAPDDRARRGRRRS
jgi:aspartokinase/homoserine dehydrogenase 1